MSGYAVLPPESHSTLTPEQIKQAKESFDLFDMDKSGTITTKELGTVMRALGQNPTEEEVQRMVNEVDLNGNGIIDFAEFVNLYATHLKTPFTKQELKDCFARFDKDGNGFITRDELANVMTSLGEKLSDQELAEMMADADVNGDGKINYDEFVTLLLSNVK